MNQSYQKLSDFALQVEAFFPRVPAEIIRLGSGRFGAKEGGAPGEPGVVGGGAAEVIGQG